MEMHYALELTLTTTRRPTQCRGPLGPPRSSPGSAHSPGQPARIEGESNPFVINPLDPGQALFQAMGGESLLTHLEQTADRLLLLITDAQTAALPWEYAVLPSRKPLVKLYGLLRLLPQAPPVLPSPSGPLHLLVLTADPLVNLKVSLSRPTAVLARPPLPVKRLPAWT